MSFGHEKLDVYRKSIQYVAWVNTQLSGLSGDQRSTKDQWIRASRSIPLNIAEGNGKALEADRRRFFEIARGSALECAAIQDVLEVSSMLSIEDNRRAKNDLDRIVAMLTKLGQRGYRVREERAEYNVQIDSDTDGDFDSDEDKEKEI